MTHSRKTNFLRIVNLLLTLCFLLTAAFAEEASPSPVPGQEEETPEPEAWTRNSDGERIEGLLSEIIPLCGNGRAIYILSAEKIRVRRFCLADLKENGKGIYFLPDTEIFGNGYEVILSRSERLEDRIVQEDIENAGDGEEEIWFWTARIQTATAVPTPKITETPDPDPTETPVPEETEQPTEEPTETPEADPTEEATPETTETPAAETTETPAPDATERPTEQPTLTPEAEMTEEPIPEATETPAAEATEIPVPDITEQPTEEPTLTPAPEATETPIPNETESPTEEPTVTPDTEMTAEPIPETTETPAPEATETPIPDQTESPTEEPTVTPDTEMTEEPTPETTETPAPETTETPIPNETESPTEEPTITPDTEMTEEPKPETTDTPAQDITKQPTEKPTEIPVAEPTEDPTPETAEPQTPKPSGTPTAEETETPVPDITEQPTEKPAEMPEVEPTEDPAEKTTETPDSEETAQPTPKTAETPVPEQSEEPVPEATEPPVSKPSETPAAEATETPVADATEQPTEEPAEIPEADPTEEPAEKPTKTPDAEPSGEPIPEGTPGTVETPPPGTPETAAPDESEQPTEEPTAAPTAVVPEIPGPVEPEIPSAEQPPETTPEAVRTENPTDLSVPSVTKKPEILAASTPQIVRDVTETPSPTDTPKPDPTRIPLPTAVTKEEIGIHVTFSNRVAGKWSNQIPVIELSGGNERTAYAMILFDEEIRPLEEAAVSFREEGIKVLRFALLDRESGEILDASSRFSVMLDFTEPEIIAENDYEKDFRVNVTAADELSGACAISADGGETWLDILDGETVHLDYTEKTEIPAGTILVRDVAGNLAVLESKITADKVYSGGWGGGRTTVKHSTSGKAQKNGGENGASLSSIAYDLTLPEEPVPVLTLGNETESVYAVFTGQNEKERILLMREELRVLYRTEAEMAEKSEGTPNALVLTASVPEEEGKISWSFGGAVLSRLRESGIGYLVLVSDSHALVVSAGEILQGTVYAKMKREGMGSRYFSYQAEIVPEGEPSVRLSVTADGKSWQLLDEGSEEMRCREVYALKSAELLGIPVECWFTEEYADDIEYPKNLSEWEEET